jgi:3-oxoacyl-[acyl-carrier protein] reductase
MRRDAADSVVSAITEAGGEAIACRADVADAPSVKDVVARVMDRWGRIDAWIHNAGMIDDRLVVATPDAAWDRVIAVNLSSAWHAIRAVAPVMIAQESGVILNVASLAALQGRRGQSAYTASKAGLIALTRAAARELAPHGIRVNAVCPPVVDTDSAVAHAPALRAQQLFPGPIEPHQVADAVFAVLSLPWISGHTFILDNRIAEGALSP